MDWHSTVAWYTKAQTNAKHPHKPVSVDLGPSDHDAFGFLYGPGWLSVNLGLGSWGKMTAWPLVPFDSADIQRMHFIPKALFRSHGCLRD
jgi:hypothetical protein